MRSLRLLLLTLLLAAPAALAECPSCSGAAEPKQKSVWPLVGAFLLVPPAIAGTVIVAMRRETRR